MSENRCGTWEEWCELYEYVKNEVLEYPKRFKLPKFMILRLHGLSKGNFIANKHIKPKAFYTYKEILLTFKYYNAVIKPYLRSKQFKDEQHKFNYIMVIIESNINNIALKLEYQQEQTKKIENIEVDYTHDDNINSNYTPRSKIKNDKLKDLW